MVLVIWRYCASGCTWQLWQWCRRGSTNIVDGTEEGGRGVATARGQNGGRCRQVIIDRLGWRLGVEWVELVKEASVPNCDAA